MGSLQARLLEMAPSQYAIALGVILAHHLITGLWLMPLDCLHMTVLEVTHSKTESEIEHLVALMRDGIPKITDCPFDHRARLVKPMLSYDAAAIALSFVPAAGEALAQTSKTGNDTYTYHHLRRDVYALSKKTGVEIASRYTVPSSHLTIARFVTQKDVTKHEGQGIDPGRMTKMVKGLEAINAELQSQWPKGAGDWIVGEEKGLDCRKGRLWYGGGQTVHLGNGFVLDEKYCRIAMV